MLSCVDCIDYDWLNSKMETEDAKPHKRRDISPDVGRTQHIVETCSRTPHKAGMATRLKLGSPQPSNEIHASISG
ncbi:MAG: hypothetical protein QF516_10130 [Pirellulaceae bacterium]|nr:hypothetical protein [Pirellulaceae bacterium]